VTQGAQKGPVPVMMRTLTLEEFVAVAARQLKAAGWTIARCRGGRDAPWHLAARKGERWRVVQVLAPEMESASRLQERIRLGQSARLSGKTGTMEQWLGHIRPGGHVTFGHDVLSRAAWGTNETQQELRERLGLPARPAPAVTSPSVASPALSPTPGALGP
jgi:hypothetical protein